MPAAPQNTLLAVTAYGDLYWRSSPRTSYSPSGLSDAMSAVPTSSRAERARKNCSASGLRTTRERLHEAVEIFEAVVEGFHRYALVFAVNPYIVHIARKSRMTVRRDSGVAQEPA